MAEFDGITDFVKSGPRRLRDAEELLQEPSLLPDEAGAVTRHLRGAMYLAGYGVECLLKAYLIEQEGCQRLSQAQDKINARRATRGEEPINNIGAAAGHSIPYLLRLTDLEARMEGPRRRQFGICAKWRSLWRYDARPATRHEAEEFVAAARTLVDWLTPQITRR